MTVSVSRSTTEDVIVKFMSIHITKYTNINKYM